MNGGRGLGEKEDRAGNRTVWIGSGVGKAGEKEQKLAVEGEKGSGTGWKPVVSIY